MKRNTFRLVVLLGTFSIIGIIIIQIYWVRRSFDIKDKEFNQTISIALKNVASQLAAFNKAELPSGHPVNQLSSAYFVVNVNTTIDANILEHYLKSEFARHNITTDFEYAIYDCASNEMVYGNYINMAEGTRGTDRASSLPSYDKYLYYFGIYFPSKSTFLMQQMDIWIFSSLVLMAVIIFFGYALSVILKQNRLSQVQKDFINNMTHEFKTPISTIAISADVLSKPDILDRPNVLKNYANIIKDENNRLLKQVEKVLQMASLDKQGIKLNIEEAGLHELVLQTIMNFRGVVEEKGGTIDTDLKAETPIIKADKVHLNNMLNTLLDNAVKYSPGKPEITVATRRTAKGIILTVADKGIGIARQHQKKVFEKFYRVPTGNVHDVKGFGLGLHYIHTMVQAHRWKVTLESEPGKGSSFSILLPA
ncbi:MAG: HAMP domain-containing histidine kinase [Bacteroidota bacterium]|nr:HAMP domain-containing histidine kinase [Bacteroidota bacterium]